MLELRDLRKRFGSTRAVDGLSLRAGAGEVFGLLGPNGAGKSTTFSMLAGLLRPDGGEVLIGGEGGALPPTDRRARARLGLAPQRLALYERLSGRENLLFFGRLRGLRGQGLRARVDELLEGVGLASRGDDASGVYSGGMARRLNLAIALVHRPPVVLLDEPTAGVDPHSRHAVHDLVRAARADGACVVLATHDMHEAQALCDRVAVIDRGKALACGPVHELIRDHGGRAVVTIERDRGDEPIETEDPLGVLAGIGVGTGSIEAGVLGVRVERASLETVFLNLTGRSLRD
ncbi:MAG: ABC transporter ATP-binding protein [Planctomycetota bacterium]